MLSDFPKDRASAEEFDHFLDLVYKLNQAEETGYRPPIRKPHTLVDKILLGASYVTLPVFTISVLALGTSSPPEIVQPVTDILTNAFSKNQRDMIVFSSVGLLAASAAGIIVRQNYLDKHAERHHPVDAMRIDLEIYDSFHKYGEICKYKETPERWEARARHLRENGNRFQ